MKIVSVNFKEGGRVYDFRAGDIGLELGTAVIVLTARGEGFGWVVGVRDAASNAAAELKPVLRIADESDMEHAASLRARRQHAFDVCERKIQEKGLEMVPVDVEIGFDDGKITIYFTAENRVDFRELVRELAGLLRARIELRQIGARDEAKMTGGIGSCGRVLCCSSFLTSFVPVSIKMAKEQGIALSPTKISGLCGRLMCCLKYEQDTYESMRKNLPRAGREVQTPQGRATVAEVSVLTETVKTKRQGPDGVWVFEYYPVAELTWNREPPKPKPAEQNGNGNGEGGQKPPQKPRPPRPPRPAAPQAHQSSQSPRTPQVPQAPQAPKPLQVPQHDGEE